MQWSILENETQQAYQAFCVYVVLNKANLSEVSKVLHRKAFELKELAVKHSWEARKEAFLNHIAAKDVQKMHLRHIEKAIALQEKALKKFELIKPENLSNSEVIRFLTAGANLERLARKSFEGANPQESFQEDDLGKVESFLEADL